MKKLALAFALTLGMLTTAHATDGNNGSGNGGCGVGQQTNGCGTPGPIGPQGPAGPMGPQGPQGEKGDTGATGATGAQGAKGDTGTAGKDGVNGSNGSNGSNGKDGATGQTGATGAQGTQGLQGAAGKDAVLPTNLATKQDVQTVQDSVNMARREAYAGTASAMAIASLPQPTEPGRSMVAAGAATYRGQQGYAIGVSHVTGSNRYVLKGAVTGDSRGGFGAAVGAGFQF